MKTKALITSICLLIGCLITFGQGESEIKKGISAFKKKDYATALEYYKKAADMGSADAMNRIGVLYSSYLPERNPEVAFQWYLQSAQKGNVNAMNHVAGQYHKGSGVEKNNEEAIKWFEEAARKGDIYAEGRAKKIKDEIRAAEELIQIEKKQLAEVEAKKNQEALQKTQKAETYSDVSDGIVINAELILEEGEEDYKKGVQAYEVKNYAEAFKWFSKAAAIEHSDAMYAMAMFYGDGLHVAKDRVKALEWLKKAAAKNSVNAMDDLGYFYYEGKGGVSKNLKEAFKFSKKAAERGSVKNMSKVGYYYEVGEGVTKNPSIAIAWYKEAAKRNDSMSMYRLAFMYGTGSGVAINEKEAFKWLLQAAEHGDVVSMGMLSQYYEDGTGVAKNEVEAFKWSKKAAEKDNVICMTSTGNFYLEGRGIQKNPQEAIKWYKKAAAKNEPTAMYNLAMVYVGDGHGVPKNLNEAFTWVKKAAEFKDTKAMVLLGNMYFDGEGVPANKEQALSWFEKAATAGNLDGMMLAAFVHYKAEQYPKAFQWYKNAANKGDAVAMYMVGLFTAQGWGTTANTEESWKWVRKSADAGYALAKEGVKQYDDYHRRLAELKKQEEANRAQAANQTKVTQKAAPSTSWGGFSYTAETTARADRAKRESESKAQMERYKQQLNAKIKSIR